MSLNLNLKTCNTSLSMEALFNLFNDIYPMSPELQTFITTHLKRRVLRKKEFLLKKYQTNTIGSFLNTGLLHCYYLENDKKITSWFLTQKGLAISVHSFFEQQQSYEYIEAMEDCEIFYLTYEELNNAYSKFLELNFINRRLIEKYYMLKEEHTYRLQIGSAKERFDWFMTTFPDLLSRVPMRHIATFLGVTEETLSRIRSSQKP